MTTGRWPRVAAVAALSASLLGGCAGTVIDDNFSALEIDDPGLVPGSHFSYAIAVTGANAFTVTATRNTVDGGTSGDLVELSVSGTGTSRSGTTAFASIK